MKTFFTELLTLAQIGFAIVAINSNSFAAESPTPAASTPATVAPTISDRPKYYVSDPSRILTPSIKRALESLVVEHDHASEEMIFISIHSGKEGDINKGNQRKFSVDLFETWKVGRERGSKGLLVVVFLKSKTLELVAGNELEPTLAAVQSQTEELTKTLKEALKDFVDKDSTQFSHPLSSSLLKFTLAFLEARDSPLIHKGRTDEILKALKLSDTLPLAHEEPSDVAFYLATAFLLVIVAGLFIVVLHFSTHRDYEFSLRVNEVSGKKLPFAQTLKMRQSIRPPNDRETSKLKFLTTPRVYLGFEGKEAIGTEGQLRCKHFYSAKISKKTVFIVIEESLMLGLSAKIQKEWLEQLKEDLKSTHPKNAIQWALQTLDQIRPGA